MQSKLFPLAAVALLLGILFDYLIFEKTPGISVLLYTATALTGTLYLARLYRARLGTSAYALIPVILFFASMVFVRASEFLTLLNILLITYLLLLEVKLAYSRENRLPSYRISDYFSGIPWLIPQSLRAAYQELLTASSSSLRSQHKSSYIPYLRGIALSLPILVVLLLLLSSADLVFKKYVGGLLDIQIDGEIVFRVLLMGFIASIFLGAYALMFTRPKTEAAASRSVKQNLGATETAIILGSVGLLFLVFVGIQAAYLFGGTDQITAAGFTYAEYARKGFFELITVAVITMALIWAVKQSGRHETPRHQRLFKVLCGILIAEVLVIMISAHMRLSLYESAYGFTELRLLSHLFILWLAVSFVSLLIHIIWDEPEHRFAFRSFISVIAFFALLNIINPEALISRQNIARYEKTGKLDTYYLQQLSADAAPEISKLLSSPDAKVRDQANRILIELQAEAREQQEHWQSYNISRDRAAGADY